MKIKHLPSSVALLAILSACAHKPEKTISIYDVPSDKIESCKESSQQKIRTAGIVPQFPPAKITQVYAPILQKIGSMTDLCIELVMSKNIPEFEKLLMTERIDYAFMNPYHQVMVKDKYTPIIRDKTRLLTGIIVTHKQSDIKNISDLNGRRLFLPAPNAFGASLLTREILRRNGIEPEVIFVKTHPNVYRNVFFDQSSAGGGVNNTLIKEQESLKSNLRIVFETEGFPAHPFSGSKRLSPRERESVALAMKQLSKDPQFRAKFRQAQMSEPIDTDYTRDYKELEELGLEEFIQHEADDKD